MDLINNKIEELEAQRTSWNVEKESIEFIVNSVDFLDNIRVLEIGCFNGYSALWFSRIADRVVTIEIERDRYEESKKNLEGADNVEVILGDACDIISTLDEKFNVVFIDGKKFEYKKYLERVLGVLEDDFMIFVDNTISHKDNMCDFFDYLKSSEDLEWKETGIGDGLVVVKRKTWGLG
jgi:predicted O-methyltransferase YrrM|tara:strand:+ start:1357 stop:1893 length:537 start_codon:yes stop_codon:yes gene_type:complete